MLSEVALLAQGEDKYMDPVQIEFFRKRLEKKADELRERLYRNQQACQVLRQPDETDAAATEALRSLTLNIIARDSHELACVARALETIKSGSHYGYCHETGEPIGLRRLLVLPESLYSVESMRATEAKNLHRRRVT